MDSKRKDGEDREINHHGKIIKVGKEDSKNKDSNVLVIILYRMNEFIMIKLSYLVCSGKKLLIEGWKGKL